jgi:hypothetical protein
MKKKTIITVLLTIIALILVRKGVSFVYDKIEVMNAPTMQEIVEANPWTVPTDWFKTDTITIKGRIEDYDAEQFGFTSMACYYNDVFDKNNTVLVLDIADDGTFCKKFLASYPVCNSFIADGSKVFFNAIRFFARPGETIDVTVRKGTFGRYECIYNNGSSHDVERWLRTSRKLEGVMKPLWEFEGTFNEANEVADEVWRRAMARLQKVIRSEDYTPMEVQLALADEETVCLTYRDFDRLRELFQFNGIPHYETITPDGRRVHENLSIHGYDDFDSELQRLLERLK